MNEYFVECRKGCGVVGEGHASPLDAIDAANAHEGTTGHLTIIELRMEEEQDYVLLRKTER